MATLANELTRASVMVARNRVLSFGPQDEDESSFDGSGFNLAPLPPMSVTNAAVSARPLLKLSMCT